MRRSKKRVIGARLDPRGVGQRIRAARLGLAWRQKDLACAVEMTPKTVACWECGARIPRPDTLVVLAVALRRTLDWIVLGRHARKRSGIRAAKGQSGSTPQPAALPRGAP